MLAARALLFSASTSRLAHCLFLRAAARSIRGTPHTHIPSSHSSSSLTLMQIECPHYHEDSQRSPMVLQQDLVVVYQAPPRSIPW